MPNGTRLAGHETPPMTTSRTGVSQRDQIVGTLMTDGDTRCLSLGTGAATDEAAPHKQARRRARIEAALLQVP